MLETFVEVELAQDPRVGDPVLLDAVALAVHELAQLGEPIAVPPQVAAGAGGELRGAQKAAALVPLLLEADLQPMPPVRLLPQPAIGEVVLLDAVLESAGVEAADPLRLTIRVMNDPGDDPSSSDVFQGEALRGSRDLSRPGGARDPGRSSRLWSR